MGIFDFLRSKKKPSEETLASGAMVRGESKIPVETMPLTEAQSPEAELKMSNSPKIKLGCASCDAYYKRKEGKFGVFAGCSRFPSCKASLSLPELVLKNIYISQTGA